MTGCACFGIIKQHAVMAELADALVLGASGQPCEFESHWPHSLQKRDNFFYSSA